jgi:hypothetical protein
MLPGLRFLFVAIVLSMSMLVFGLGAAALLRSAHEEFANLPTRRAQPEPVFAQPVETTRPTLALLRVDVPPEPALPDRSAPTPTPPPEETKPVASTDTDKPAAEPERVVTLTPAPQDEKSGTTETAADLPSAASTPAEMPVRADIAVVPVQAVVPQEPPTQTETKAAVAEPPSLPADDGATAASMRIATLGGPEVTIDAKTASKQTLATLGKSAEPRRRVKRRRIVRRVVMPARAPEPGGLFEPVQTAAVSQRRRN